MDKKKYLYAPEKHLLQLSSEAIPKLPMYEAPVQICLLTKILKKKSAKRSISIEEIEHRPVLFFVWIFLFIGLLFIVTTLTGCYRDLGINEKNIIYETGTVKFVSLEGGFYGIIGDNNQNYDPINLSEEFQVDGLRVYFRAKIGNDIVSVHMWGTLVEILEIEEIESE